MALKFAVTGDYMEIAAKAAIDNFDPFTFFAWIRPDTISNFARIMHKTTGSTDLAKVVFCNGTGGDIRVDVDRATTNAQYITDNTPLANGVWSFVAVVYDSSAGSGEVIQIYHANVGEDLAECTYGTSTDGSGATEDDDSSPLRVCGERVTVGAQGFAARCGPWGYINEALGMGELQNMMYRPGRPMREWAALCFPSLDGAGGCPDFSGNAHSVTVENISTVGDPPIGPFFGSDFGLALADASGDTESVNPVTISVTVPSVTITHTENVSPVSVTVTPPAVATGASLAVDPVSVTTTPPAVTTTHTQDVTPVSVTVNVPAPTTNRAVTPVSVTLGVPAVTITHTENVSPVSVTVTPGAATALTTLAVDAVSVTITPPAATTTHTQDVDPVGLTVTPVAPTVDTSGEAVSPVSVTVNVPSVTTSHAQAVSPVVVTVSAPAVSVDPFAVTVTRFVQVAGGLWYMEWTSNSDGPFYLYENGILIATTYATKKLVHFGRNENPVFEVIADPDAEPIDTTSGRFTLNFAASSDTANYRIEEYIASTWTPVDIVPEDGSSLYQYRTRALDDDTTHQFRVVPVGTNGNDGTPITGSRKLRRHPDPPQVTASLNNPAQTVTFTET